MTMWFTSDPQFGDPKSAEKRGYGSVEEHDAALMKTYAESFLPHDVVWWLGDVSVNGMAGLSVLRDTIRVLPGNHQLVLGNNDIGHPCNGLNTFVSSQVLREYLKTFDTVQLHASFKAVGVPGGRLMLSHFPYFGDTPTYAKDPRWLPWRLRNQGRIVLHGHVHSEDKISYFNGSTQVHVGLEAWDRKPVSFGDISKLLQEKLGYILAA